MAKLWTLLLTLTISTLFIHVPAIGAIGFALNPDVTLDYNQYFWVMSWHLTAVIQATIIWDETKDYKDIILVYLAITVADMVFFFLSYDDPLKDYRITWNILKTVAFGAAIAWKCRK